MLVYLLSTGWHKFYSVDLLYTRAEPINCVCILSSISFFCEADCLITQGITQGGRQREGDKEIKMEARWYWWIEVEKSWWNWCIRIPLHTLYKTLFLFFTYWYELFKWSGHQCVCYKCPCEMLMITYHVSWVYIVWFSHSTLLTGANGLRI